MVRLTFVVGGGKGVRARYDDSMPVRGRERRRGRERKRGHSHKNARVILKEEGRRKGREREATHTRMRG